MKHGTRRRLFEIIPTWFFIGLFCFSLYNKSISYSGWVNQFVFSLVGLFLYSSVTFVIEGMAEGIEQYSNIKVKGWGIKLFYAYFVFCWFIPIIIGIYLMNHN